MRAAAPAIPASSSACAAGARPGASSVPGACRRCGFRAAREASSRPPALRDCARCRPRAPSRARHRAYACPRAGRPPAPQGSAGTPRASCRRPSARSAVPTAPAAPLRAAPPGAHAASSAGARTSLRLPRAGAWEPWTARDCFVAALLAMTSKRCLASAAKQSRGCLDSPRPRPYILYVVGVQAGDATSAILRNEANLCSAAWTSTGSK